MAVSREATLPSGPSGTSSGPRMAMSRMETTSTTPRKTRKVGPIADWVNECTELKTPLRVMKVPRMVRRKLPSDRLNVHSFSVCRRSCTIAEWRKAVAVSQGRNEAFSTGSHAQ